VEREEVEAMQNAVFWLAVIALATTLTLPDRKTGDVLEKGFGGASQLLGTAMGTRK
jgi:hypothetical protein